MKKQIAIAALTFGAIVLGTNNVQAQEVDKNSATTDATIDLVEVISISAITAPVNFIYKTAYDYNNNQTVKDGTTLTVTSSKDFDIKVNAGGANFMNGTNTIPVDVLTINAKSGGTVADSVELSNKEQTLVTKSPKGSELTWELDYTIPKEKSSTVILGMPTGKYTQTIMYTVTNSN